MSNTEVKPEIMSCMEVWGGNDSADRSIVMPGLDAWMFSHAYGETVSGGDVYYVSSCATGRIIRLLVADVSGHGEAVVEPAIMLRTLMRRYVNQIDQRRFVRSMNSAFSALSQSGLFATAVVASYFAPTRTLSITNAGHPPPVLYDAISRTWSFMQLGCVENTAPTDIPLGVLELSEYEEHAQHLHTGDIVLLYTDALSECRNTEGKILSQEAFTGILAQLDISRPGQMIPELLKELRTLNSRNLVEDDITILLITPNDQFEIRYETPGFKHHMLAMKKFVAALLSADEPVPWPDLNLANLGGAMCGKLNKLWGRNLKP